MRRTALGLLIVVLSPLGLALALLGGPDWRDAADFLLSNHPTEQGAAAAAQVLVWAVGAVAMTAAIISGGRDSARRAGRRNKRLAWSLAIMLAGLIVLVGGFTHHAQRTTLAMSGGSLQEARAQLAR